MIEDPTQRMAKPQQSPLRLHIIPPPNGYRDDPSDDENADGLAVPAALSPPGYVSMFEYLRDRAKHFPNLPVPTFGYTPTVVNVTPDLPDHEPYRDDPCVVEIDPPPPAYEAIPAPPQAELQYESWDDDSVTWTAEEFLKWLICMLLLALSVVGVGTAFNWGR